MSLLSFSLGTCVVTATANNAGVRPTPLLQRHWGGDWGDLDDEDREANEVAMREKDGRRLFSRYVGCGESGMEVVYVITDAPFSPETVTTVLLDSDY